MRDISFKKDKINGTNTHHTEIDDPGVKASIDGYNINYEKSLADTDFFNTIKDTKGNNSSHNDEELAAYDQYKSSAKTASELEPDTQNHNESYMGFKIIKSYDISPGVVLMVSESSPISDAKIVAITNLLKS